MGRFHGKIRKMNTRNAVVTSKCGLTFMGAISCQMYRGGSTQQLCAEVHAHISALLRLQFNHGLPTAM